MKREEITIPTWVFDEIYDTLRINRNNMIDRKETDSCIYRMTTKSMNFLSCYIAGKRIDENLDKIIDSYNKGELIHF